MQVQRTPPVVKSRPCGLAVVCAALLSSSCSDSGLSSADDAGPSPPAPLERGEGGGGAKPPSSSAAASSEPVDDEPEEAGGEPVATEEPRDPAPSAPGGTVVRSLPLGAPVSEGEGPFGEVPAESRGLVREPLYSIEDFWPPFWNGRGLAGGDYDDDGRTDLVLATEEGPRLFHNDGEGRFSVVPLEAEGLAELNTFVVALVDLVGDEGLDLFLATWRGGNWLLENQGGAFPEARELPDPRAPLSAAVPFGDIDLDGDLDAVLGNWFSGFRTRVPPWWSRNVVALNEGEGPTEYDMLEGMPGETLSALLSDLDQDGQLDLLVGNDFVQPDVQYWGREGSEFERVTHQDEVFPLSTWSTMSLDSADINNDLELDIYAVQIARGKRRRGVRYETHELDDYCQGVTEEKMRARCEQIVEARALMHYRGNTYYDRKRCKRLPRGLRRECRDHTWMRAAIRDRSHRWCRQATEGSQSRVLCEQHLDNRPIRRWKYPRKSYVKQRMYKNVLWQRYRGRYVERAEELGVAIGGWGWNGKFADLTLDGWQDLYIANGTWIEADRRPPNLFYENREGRYFEDKTAAFGLGDPMVVSAYVYLDLDDDGDLDIVTNALAGPLKVYINNARRPGGPRAVRIALRDKVGNSRGVGARVVVGHGPGGEKRQLREIKAGGGFLSYDPPEAHFGLGEDEELTFVEVTWPTGPPTRIEGRLPAGHRYVIERRSLPPEPGDLPEEGAD